MNQNKMIWALSLCLIMTLTACAQQAERKYKFYHAGITDVIEVTCNKTLNLLFPYPIKSVDAGSQDLFLEKVKGTENVLRIKAARPGFPETSLSIITSDGKIYCFIVNYTKNLRCLSIDLSSDSSSSRSQTVPVKFANSSLTESDIVDVSRSVVTDRKFIGNVKSHKYGTMLSIPGIYIKSNLLFLRLDLINRSPIGFDIDYMRFYIRDKKRMKRTAIQENDVPTVYVYGKTDKAIQNDFPAKIVLAIQKFTIPDGKQFVVEIFEKNGGRNLRCIIKNKKLLQAKVLFD